MDPKEHFNKEPAQPEGEVQTEAVIPEADPDPANEKANIISPDVFPEPKKSNKPLTVPHAPPFHKSQQKHHEATDEAKRQAAKSAALEEHHKRSKKHTTVPQEPHFHTSPHYADEPIETTDSAIAAAKKGEAGNKKPATVFKAPKLSTSNRTVRTATSVEERKTAAAKHAPGYVPTKPHGPKLSTASRASVRPVANVMGTGKINTTIKKKTDAGYSTAGTENQPPSKANIRGSANSSGAGYGKRKPTVPVGPKFSLDAKYGEKVNSASSLSSSNNSRSSDTSLSASTSSSAKRSLTVPVGPKFMLDAKYGEKPMSAATSTATSHSKKTTTKL